MKRQFGLVTMLALIATFIFGSAGTVGAAGTTVVVTPTNTQGWSTADTRPGGAVNFVVDATAPRGAGALNLTTAATTAAKAQYLHDTNTSLASVTELSYYTKQVSPPSPPIADPSYQLAVCLTGIHTTPTPGCNLDLSATPKSSFTTLVFEPYQNLGNNGNAAIVLNAWQKWDVAAGFFWSTHTIVCSNGTIVGTAGGPATYTLSAVQTACPNAVVFQYGVNIGTNNPSYTVETDLFDFDGTTYDFDPNTVATNKNQCKDGGWQNFNPPNGPYKNQGQCVSSTNHQGGND